MIIIIQTSITSSLTTLIIYITKLLDSDWLKSSAFRRNTSAKTCNISAKICNSEQILSPDWLINNRRWDKPIGRRYFMTQFCCKLKRKVWRFSVRHYKRDSKCQFETRKISKSTWKCDIKRIHHLNLLLESF